MVSASETVHVNSEPYEADRTVMEGPDETAVRKHRWGTVTSTVIQSKDQNQPSTQQGTGYMNERKYNRTPTDHQDQLHSEPYAINLNTQ